MKSGYFGIGILHAKTEVNVGTLWRSAAILGASFIFTIGRRYKKQASDTLEAWRHIPLFHYDTFDQFYENLPHDCQLIGVELDPTSVPVAEFKHPKRAVYLLGAEDNGLTREAIDRSHKLVQLPGEHCLNVAVAGSLIMYDRLTVKP
jgi:tRNA G18 (ribose-2'-O)-methylase SpoU